jgi:hypothetical protein
MIDANIVYNTSKLESSASGLGEDSVAGLEATPQAAPMFRATPTVTIQFGPLPAVAAAPYKVQLRIVVGTGAQAQILQETYTIGAGFTPENVRDLVRGSLQDLWHVSNSGSTGLTITGLKNNPQNLLINQAGIGTTGLPAGAKSPTLGVSSGVQQLQPAAGGKWKLSFLPRFDDGSTTLVRGGEVTGTFNGVSISASLNTGMTAPQVAQALYLSMLNAGITDVVLSGSDLEFLNDPAGMETLVASLQLGSSSPSNAPAEGLLFAISPAERYVF